MQRVVTTSLSMYEICWCLISTCSRDANETWSTYKADGHTRNEDANVDDNDAPDRDAFRLVVRIPSGVGRSSTVYGALDERRRVRVRHSATSEFDEDRHLV